MIERIFDGSKELAIIIRSSYRKDEGIEFLTSGTYSQQLGYMNRPSGYVIPPHVHNFVTREVQFTQEVLFIRSGSIRVDFYTDKQKYLESTILKAGDIILLAFGGHGFEMLENAEIIEVKQGPYAVEEDKTRFEGVQSDRLIIKNDY
jgi:mannose-6-phosphate isomerase-like protein (cupin superfamily)